MTLKYNKRDFDGMLPNVSQPGKGFIEDLVGMLNGRTNSLGLTSTNPATILAGQSSVVVALAPELDGKPVTSTLMDVDATALNAGAATWGGAYPQIDNIAFTAAGHADGTYNILANGVVISTFAAVAQSLAQIVAALIAAVTAGSPVTLTDHLNAHTSIDATAKLPGTAFTITFTGSTGTTMVDTTPTPNRPLGNLTLRVNANATGNVRIAYAVDAR